ncbi:hypothetical protein CFC21_109980, partial [Triticum aestivum]
KNRVQNGKPKRGERNSQHSSKRH